MNNYFRIMRPLWGFWCVATLLFMAGCSKEYDDSELTNRVDNLENRVDTLEQSYQQLNNNISALQSIVTALQDNNYITKVETLLESGEAIGYTIYFTKSDPVTIYHGKDGQNGKDGYTPVIGVKQEADNIYYWTLDGEWLTDKNGNKIKAVGADGKDGENGKDGLNGADGKDGADGKNGIDGKDGADGKDGIDGKDGADGKDGVTPQLKIEDDYWYISYDNGKEWTKLGKATGKDGKDGSGSSGSDNLFRSVTQDELYVYFTLADGTVITLPKGGVLDITFEAKDLVVMLPNSTREIKYTVQSVTDKVAVEVTSSADIKAEAVADDSTGKSGKIVVNTGATIDKYSKVIIFVANDDKVIMRSFTFEQAGLVVDGNSTKHAAVEGGEVTLEFLSNVEWGVTITENAQSWLSIVPTTRAMEPHSVTLKVEPNSGNSRSTTVTVQSTDGTLELKYVIMQEGNSSADREDTKGIYTSMDFLFTGKKLANTSTGSIEGSTNAYKQTMLYGDSNIEILKLGTSKNAGTYKTEAIGISNASKLSFYAVGWKDKKVKLTVNINGVDTVLELTANVGAAGNSPYNDDEGVLEFNDNTDYYTIDVTGITATSTISFATDSSGCRALICGVQLY